MRCRFMCLPAVLFCWFVSFSAVHGQPGGTQVHGNATVTRSAAPASETDASPAVAFRPDGTVNHSASGWWYYRVSGDSRERPFGSYTKSDGGQINGTSSYVDRTAAYEYGEFTSSFTTRFFAQYASLLTEGASPGHASVSHSMRIFNLGSSPLTITLFHYADFNIGGTALTDSATGNVSSMVITDGADSMVFSATNGSAFQVAPSPVLQSLLLDSDVDNLNNTGLPSGPGDYSGAYQWDLTIPGGSDVSVGSTWSISTAVPEPATLALTGAFLLGMSLAAHRRMNRDPGHQKIGRLMKGR